MTTPNRSAPRVTAENWRVICPCQRHARARRRLGKKRHVLLFAGSLLIVGASVPLDALETAIGLPRVERRVVASSAALAGIAVRGGGAIPFVAPVESFTGMVELPSPLRIERIRESFFRTEIPFGELIYREARRHGLEPELVAAVVQTESDFRPRLVSAKDAQGLMQVLPSTAELMGYADPMDPVQNIRAGTRYLKYLTEEFSEPTMVLAAYNAGPGRVKQHGAIPPFRETRDYVRKVEQARKRFRRAIAERLTAPR